LPSGRRLRGVSDEPEIGPGTFAGQPGEWVRLVRDGSLRFISDTQLADIKILRRGGDPCSVILPDDWAAPERDESEEAPQSGRRFEDLL